MLGFGNSTIEGVASTKQKTTGESNRYLEKSIMLPKVRLLCFFLLLLISGNFMT